MTDPTLNRLLGADRIQHHLVAALPQGGVLSGPVSQRLRGRVWSRKELLDEHVGGLPAPPDPVLGVHELGSVRPARV